MNPVAPKLHAMTNDTNVRNPAKLALAITAGLGLAIVVTLTVLWFAYVDAPDPQAVCDRIVEMTYEEGATHDPKSVDALVSRLRDGCVQSKSKVIQYRGKIEWARYAKCVMSAENLNDAEGC
jgi:hypothetical protein